MNQFNHYLPFVVITFILYGFFFYQNDQASIVQPQPLNSGKQSVQVSFMEEQQSKPVVAENANSKIEKAEIKSEQADTPKTETVAKTAEAQTKQAIKPTTNQAVKIQSSSASQVQINNSELRKKVLQMSTASTAMLKSELYEQDFNFDLPFPPAVKNRTAEQAAKQYNKAKQQAAKKSKPVVKKTVKTFKAPVAPIAKEKPKQTAPKAKRVFKKAQVATGSVAEQGVLQEAEVVSGKQPTYPSRAIQRGQEGRVVVKLTVTMQGNGKNPVIMQSSGFDMLDQAVLDFVQTELFMPALKGNERVSSEQEYSFRFQLN